MNNDEYDQMLARVVKMRGADPSEPRTECPSCGHVVRPFYLRCPQCEGPKNLYHVEALAVVIRDIKANPPVTPDAERIALKRLHALCHPCPAEFLQVIAKKQQQSKTTRGSL